MKIPLISILLALAAISLAPPAWADAPAPQSQPAPAAAPVAVPAPTAAGVSYYRSGNMLWIVTTLWSFAVPLLILLSGLNRRLRALAERAGKRWYASLPAYYGLFLLTCSLLYLPLDFYSGFLRPRAYAISSLPLSTWAVNTFVTFALELVAGALLIWIPYLLLKRATRRWWLYSWLAAVLALTFTVYVQPVVIAPLFNHFEHLQDKPLEKAILAEARRAQLNDVQVLEVDNGDNDTDLDAYVTGLGGTTRIVLSKAITQRLSAPQLLFVVGHEMGHYVLRHIPKTLLLVSLLLLGVAWLTKLIAERLLRRLAARPGTGLTTLEDPSSLPLFLLILTALSFLLTPLGLAYHRHLEHEADRFGLELTRDNAACASAYVVLTEKDLGYPDPGLFYTVFQADHPSIAERIRFCNSYHPWTTGGTSGYAAYMEPRPR